MAFENAVALSPESCLNLARRPTFKKQKFKVGVVTASRDRVGTLKGAPAIGSLSPAGCLVTPLGEPLSGVPRGGKEV